ncbi:MAG TPA: 16S rRNA (adenine(1518)-N(6)/adenine(1519)-N(6))-dimethyltransferase RsmA [Vicinamibacterales bacterium]|nr:16S rRNA (adenine(1518)-N(6)/adenine(1519)-N(6))-dimethyltransferase RsmA [Vicinamibacterales bacterium]
MIRARKRFGQHFLERAWVDKVIRAIDPHPDQTFIEIGPGGGALTRPLAALVRAVVAYEIDRDLAADLRHAAVPNLAVVEGDFLAQASGALVPHADAAQPIRVAGNLPYNVASPILFKLAELFAAGTPIADATVMLQREVADRLTAAAGSREYGVLSVLMQHVARIELLLELPAGAFRPPPKVLSSLVRLHFHAPDPPVIDPIVFASLVQAVFTRRRKTLVNALHAYTDAARAGRAVAAAGLDGSRRPETLSVAEFARLADIFAA